MAEILVGDVPNADQLPEVNLPAFPVPGQELPVEDAAPAPVVTDPLQVIDVPLRPEPQPAIEPSLTWQQRMDEGEGDNWLEKFYGNSVANRDVVRGPAGQELSKQGLDSRNLLEDESFGGSTSLFDRMVAPYKKAAEVVGNVTWEDIRFANQEAGNAMVTGIGKAAQGFIDLTGELAEVAEEAMPLGFLVWDKDGLRIEETRPEGVENFTIPKFWTEPETEVGKIGADLFQFVSAMAATSMGTLGTIPYKAGRYMAYGAVADTLFDPAEGNFSTMLMDLGVEPNAVLEFLGTPVGEDAEAAERLAQRLKNAFEGGLIGLPFDLAPLAFKAIKALKENPDMLPKAVEHLRSKSDEMLETAGRRWSENKSPIPMGLSIEDVGPGADPLLTAATRAANLRDQPVRSEGGVVLPEAKTSESLRLHQQRVAKMREKGAAYPGAPKNPRTVITAPEGSGLPDVVIGDVTPEDWRVRIEAAMTPDEIAEASKWYEIIYDEFDRVTGGNREETEKLAKAWLSAQQNESPEAALHSVIQIYEQVQRGVPVAELKGKGLPNADAAAIAAILKAPIESGVGQKISDFIDSQDNKNVRTIMNNDPAGGSPFVVDVHTGRDTGLVDQEFINHLTRLGYQVPDDVITDLAGGGIKGAQYENRVLFGHQLTDHLNDMNWMGRSDWEPREIQAIGWSQLTKMYGDISTAGGPREAITRHTRRIAIEVTPGEGSPWAIKYGDDYKLLDIADQYAITEQVTSRAIDLVNEREGINLGNIVHASGGWRLEVNPSAVRTGVMSRDSAKSAASRLAYYLNQTEAWVNSAKGMTKTPSNYGIDILEAGTQNLRNNDRLLELWGKIVEADPAVEFKGKSVAGLMRGYQPIEDVNGDVGIRIIVDKEAMKEWAKAHKTNLAGAREAVNEFFTTKLDDIAENLDYDIRRQLHESELDKARNNWTEQPDGQSHLENIRDTGRSTDPAQGGTDIDLDRGELEKLFGDLIGEAKGRAPTAEGQEAVAVGGLERRGPEGVVRRAAVGGEHTREGRKTTEFFADITTGQAGRPDLRQDYEPVIRLGRTQPGTVVFDKEYQRHLGNFDLHIATSIPGFREVQAAVGHAIVKTLPSGGTVLDIGASEGALVKAIAATSDGRVAATALDPNVAMSRTFLSGEQVPGADYRVEAFGTKGDEGRLAWTEDDGTPIRYFKPDRRYDIVHETMVFQFISGARDGQIRRMKELATKDGLIIIEEKFVPGGSLSQKQWAESEAQKDAFKHQYFSKKETTKKKETILVGMHQLMVTPSGVEKTLGENFDHVVQFWDVGNFKGYIASDNRQRLDAFLKNLEDLNTEFSTTRTPREVDITRDVAAPTSRPPDIINAPVQPETAPPSAGFLMSKINGD